MSRPPVGLVVLLSSLRMAPQVGIGTSCVRGIGGGVVERGLGYRGCGARVDGRDLLVELHHLGDASLALLELVLHGLLLRLYVTHVLASWESDMMRVSYHRLGEGVNLRGLHPLGGGG